jgi:signal transduction histidine kinase
MLIVARGERMREDVEPMLLQRFVPEFLSAQPPAEPAREVRTDIPGDLPPVLANHGCLDQILENLLTNARKYSTPGHPSRSAPTSRTAAWFSASRTMAGI